MAAERRNKIKLLKLALALLFLHAFWIQSSQTIKVPTFNRLCYNQADAILTDCQYGGYIVNPNRTQCKDRYICYGNVGDICKTRDEQRLCLPGLTCQCGKCMNCANGLCKMEICPHTSNEIFKKWLKRIENNLMDYDI